MTTTTQDTLLLTRALPDHVFLLLPKDAAEYLGVSTKRLDELYRRGWLPAVQFGVRSRHYRREDLLECAARIRAAEEAKMARPQFTAMAPGVTPKRGVYFVQAGDDGPIKIGYSDNIRVRLLSLQAASPAELRLLNVRPGGPQLEVKLHQKLAPHRMHHEWFEPAEDVLQEVAST